MLIQQNFHVISWTVRNFHLKFSGFANDYKMYNIYQNEKKNIYILIGWIDMKGPYCGKKDFKDNVDNRSVTLFIFYKKENTYFNIFLCLCT